MNAEKYETVWFDPAEKCDHCGLPSAPLVAAGSSSGVPRAPDGTWCSGIQCQGQQGLPGFEKPLQGPMIESNMTAGQKAAWTKKQNKLKAESAAASAAAEAKVQQDLVDFELRSEIATGEPVSASKLQKASPEVVDEYLAANMSEKNLGLVVGGPEQRRQVALNTNDTHILDRQQLEQVGYKPGMPKGANESHQTLMREKAMRRPTGGPSDGTYKEYTNSEVEGMSRQQQERFVRHHRPDALTDPSELSDVGLRNTAIASNKDYITTRNDLIDSGADPTRIPTSHFGAKNMVNGSPGLASGTVKQPVKVSAPSVPKASTGAKPPEWDSWSGAKKAAWTKKQNKLNGAAKVEVAKPAGWDSWGAGKKAAWTKKQNLSATGSVSTSGSGTHEIKSASYKSLESLALSNPPAGEGTGRSAHHSRYQSFHSGAYGGSVSDRQALGYYTGSGHTKVNPHHKYGKAWDSKAQATSEAMDNLFLTAGSPAPAQLIRGKNRGPMADLDYTVGTVYTEPGFGSFSSQVQSAANFSNPDSDSKGSVITKVMNSGGFNSIPGTDYEFETIMPRGVQYKVTKIVDHVHPTTGKIARYMEVEII